MATYHVVFVPRPDLNIDPSDWPASPLMPRDITAESEEDALEEAKGIIVEVRGEWWEFIADMKDEHAAAREAAWLDHWEPRVYRVNRPAVELEAVPTKIEQKRDDGTIAGWTCEYHTRERRQRFKVLLDGVVAGQLLERPATPEVANDASVWSIASASGPLSWKAANGLMIACRSALLHRSSPLGFST
jgi:hypothetical protein